MKTVLCLCFLALIAATLAKTPKEKLREYSEACKAESGVSEELLEKVRNHEDVSDPKLQAHGVCILKKAGFMDEHGELQVDVVKEKFKAHGEDAEKVAERCAVKKASPGETSDAFFRCIYADKNH